MWLWLKKPGVGLALFGGAAGMALFLFAFDYGMAKTNTMEFCISCHEMRDNVYQEYKKSYHFSNATGVQATCVDCHVPLEYPDQLYAKIIAAKDVYHTIIGTIDTREKFEANRLAMAKRVWAGMERRESKECRNCHKIVDMRLDEQGRRARRVHEEAAQNGSHCIQCHKGIVHQLPEGYEK
ncbi:MAG: NapC/NirT family cytochrome c [Magnetospiraceae bacterium]